ncbi:hypothetical protein DCO48_08395 [Pseudomonas sp. SDI]|uniref:hypothetical protein n=1 Tax=Pseudomonas sp. SDI TaxID=2170734 RepID=UPI000DE6975A|nr:hypothetical protein [Pseudomonas sp. SDI]PWB33989.1 hypothetical protein DCO48_08395 [Pseudomonas sp. SDI]
MSGCEAGFVKRRMFGRDEYLAPLPLPTGQKPADSLNIMWRKNNEFLDVGNYAIGAAVCLFWLQFVLVFSLACYFQGIADILFGIALLGPQLIYLVVRLTAKVHPPTRFNRQRREVCVPQADGSYWRVPWETVTAAATQKTSVGRGGSASMGMLFIGFENPDQTLPEEKRHYVMGFGCGGGETAMALWECIRSYMEIGPEAVPECQVGASPYEETQVGAFVTAWRNDDVVEVLKGLFFLTILGSYFAEKAQDLKLSPPPELDHPDIIEWSKPLPPEQWAKRSAELDAAIRKREAELAAKG